MAKGFRLEMPKENIPKNKAVRAVMWWLFCILIGTVILSVGFYPTQVSVRVGDVAQNDVFYNGAVTQFVSDIRTQEAKNKAASTVGQKFFRDQAVDNAILNEIDQFFTGVISVLHNETLLEEGAKETAVKSLFMDQKKQDLGISALAFSDRDLERLRSFLRISVRSAIEDGVTEEQIDSALNKISKDIAAASFSSQGKGLLNGLVAAIDFQPNLVYDAIATMEEIEKVTADVKPIVISVKPGEKILSKGSIVTAEEVETMQYLGLQSSKSPFITYVGVFLLVACTYLLIIYYIYKKKSVVRREANMIILGILFTLFLLVIKISSWLSISDQMDISSVSGYLVPVAAFSMLIAALINSDIAIFITAIMGIFMTLILSGQPYCGIVAIVGGMVGIYQVSSVNSRSQFVGSSFYVGLSNAVIIAALGLMNDQSYVLIGFGVLFGLINGVVSSIFMTGALPFFERAFRITTVGKLIELSNSNHPLLKQLMIEAPGTYHHCILVGNLAEAAADAIGADPLLARVASYYHDVGKLKRPSFFIENQEGGENPHDKLLPTLSTLILVSHVKDGADMLRELSFPKEIINILEQHHGTDLASFFYNKALESAEEGEEVKKSDFCYPGPKPQMKEAAIVMLADSVQAAVQSLKGPTKGQIEGKIREVIKGKLNAGQLEECDLTFKDLDIIAETFTLVLAGSQHKRIDYAKRIKEMERNKEKSGNHNGQQGVDMALLGDNANELLQNRSKNS
ncbi:MAG: HDIG domain-containing protein [Peptococcaceae bacterium]|nr:HDIG domain-containing protein [Peptococcaceae bacterium]